MPRNFSWLLKRIRKTIFAEFSRAAIVKVFEVNKRFLLVPNFLRRRARTVNKVFIMKSTQSICRMNILVTLECLCFQFSRLVESIVVQSAHLQKDSLQVRKLHSRGLLMCRSSRFQQHFFARVYRVPESLIA